MNMLSVTDGSETADYWMRFPKEISLWPSRSLD